MATTTKTYDLNGGKFTQELSLTSKSDFAVTFKDVFGNELTPAITLAENKTDAVASVNVKYKMEAAVSGTIDSQAVNTTFTFELAQYHDGSENPSEAHKALEGTYMWRAADAYDETVDPPSHLYLDGTDFASESDIHFDGATITRNSFKVYKSFDGGNNWVQIIDENELANFSTEEQTDDAFLKKLFNSQGESTLTLKNIANYGTVKFGETDVLATLQATPVDVVMPEGKTSYKGTRLSETIASSSLGEEFNMGQGSDKITFAGYTGADTVRLSGTKDDTLTLDFGEAIVGKKLNGNNLELTTKSNFRYIVTAKVEGLNGEDPYLDNAPAEEERGNLVPLLNSEGRLTFSMSMATTDADETHFGDWVFSSPAVYDDVTVRLTMSDFKNGSFEFSHAKYSDLKVYQIAGTSIDDDANPVVIKDVTSEYVSAVKACTTHEEYIALNEKYFANAWGERTFNVEGHDPITITPENGRQTAESKVTIADFGKNSTVQKVLLGETDLANQEYEVEASKNKKGNWFFNGTRLNEKITSSDKNESFNMGTSQGEGKDTIVFADNFGKDTVTVTAGDTLNLNFTNGGALSYKQSGNDLQITETGAVSYYATAHVNGNAYGNEINDQNYTFRLTAVDLPADDPNIVLKGKILWRSDESYGIYNEVAKHMALDITDFVGAEHQNKDEVGNITSYKTTFDQAEVTNLKIFKIVNGVAEEITSSYLNGYKGSTTNYSDDSLAKSLYNDKTYTFGIVTIKDFGTAVRNADVQINGTSVYGADEYNPSIYEYKIEDIKKLFTKDDSVVKNGKITTKGTTNNEINLENYFSQNGKGVQVTTGKGDDVIFGSSYNDTIKSTGGHNVIAEYAGKNTITLGKGGSDIQLGMYSSNTVKATGGVNKIDIFSQGTNKITFGSGADEIEINMGVNTINAGNGSNDFEINGGINKLTGGKHKDKFTVNSGQSTINSGKGNDEITVNGGISTINAGIGDDKFIFDNLTADIIATANGDKGKDIYDLQKVTFGETNENRIIINDKSGVNTIVLKENFDNVAETGINAEYDIYFNVKAKKGKVKSISKSLVINKENDLNNKSNAVIYNYDGKLSKGVTKNLTVSYGENTYKLHINEVASQVASWLTKNGFTSSDAAFASNCDNLNELKAIYQGTANGSFDIFTGDKTIAG